MISEDKRSMQQTTRIAASEERQLSRPFRPQTPVAKKATFEPIDHQPFKKSENHFGMVKTGNVNEKRNFWLRSTEKLHEMSPGPARSSRRRLQSGNQDWIRQAAPESSTSRPGSSMGQPMDQSNVKKSVSGWSDLSKSKSSAAVLQQQQAEVRRNRGRSRTPIQQVFQPEKNPENAHQKPVYLSEAHTNQVHETVTKWGKSASPQPAAAVARHAPSRNIGETFAETKTERQACKSQVATEESSSNAAPWRSNKAASNPEPSVKVVNVAVENGGNTMRFSESAEAQMAKHLKHSSFEQQSSMTMTTVTSSSSSSTAASSEKVSVTTQPPKSPGPSRKTPQASKGKSLPTSSAPPPPSRCTTTATSAASATSHAEDSSQKQLDSSHNLLSSSSGQISMSSTTSKQFQQQVTEQQQWVQKQQQFVEQQQEIHEMTTMTSSNDPSLPVISSWISSNEEQAKKPIKPSRTTHADKGREEMPTPPPPPMPPPQLPETVAVVAPQPVEASPPKDQPTVAAAGENETCDDQRKQRAQELVQIALAGKVKPLKDNLEDKEEKRDAKVMEARARMLQEVASLRSEAPESTEDEDYNSTSQERAAEKAKEERKRELAEIAEMRCRTNWEDVVSSTSNVEVQPRQTPDPDLEEARNTIRSHAARWQEREQSSQKIRYGTPPSGRTTPSRRIGNLFKKGSDHWSMDDNEEEFPAPPTDILMEVTLPAPPPRDSSRDVMMEYAGKRRNS